MKQMKLSRILLASLAGLVVFAACKKDKESDTTYLSLDGTLVVGEIPAYVNPGDVFDFSSEGVSVPEKETNKDLAILYTYTTSEDSKIDTSTVFHCVIPDIVGKFTITAKATAEGYYTKTVTLTTTVVSEKSITNVDRTGLSYEADPRDGQSYSFSVLPSGDWMAENLAYFEKDAEGAYTFGMPYAGAKAAEAIFGGFYTWEEAKTACPSGWRLPTKAEWGSLGTEAGKLMADSYYNGSRMWEYWPEVKKTNSYKFFAFPFGYATIVDKVYTFTGFGDYAFYWADNGGQPICEYIYVQGANINVWDSPSETDFAAQVRCIK